MNKSSYILIYLLFLSLASIWAGNNDSTFTPINLYSTAFVNSYQNNPALIGVENHPTVYLKGIANLMTEKTSLSNFEAGFSSAVGKKHRIGIGGYNSYSSNGVVRQSTFASSVSFRFIIAKDFSIRIGTSIGFNLSGEHLNSTSIARDRDDPFLLFHSKIIRYPFINGATSLLVDYKKFFITISKGNMFNFSINPQLKDNYIIKPFLYQSSIGYNIKYDHFNIQPVLKLVIDKKYMYYTPAIFVDYKNYYLLGISYNNLNALTIQAGILVVNRLRLTSSLTIPVTNTNSFIRYMTNFDIGIRFQF